MEKIIVTFLVLVLFAGCLFVSFEVITKSKDASNEIAKQILNGV